MAKSVQKFSLSFFNLIFGIVAIYSVHLNYNYLKDLVND